MWGEDLVEERAEVLVDDKNPQDEEDGFSDDSSDLGNGEEDMIELDTQEQVMLDLLQLWQDAEPPLSSLTTLLPLFVVMEGKALILGKPRSGRRFLTTCERRYLAPAPSSL